MSTQLLSGHIRHSFVRPMILGSLLLGLACTAPNESLPDAGPAEVPATPQVFPRPDGAAGTDGQPATLDGPAQVLDAAPPGPPDAAPPPPPDAALPDAAPPDLPPPCAPGCTVGVSQCGPGGGVQTCELVGGCPVFKESACSAPKMCKAQSASTATCSCSTLPCGDGCAKLEWKFEGAATEGVGVIAGAQPYLTRPFSVEPDTIGGRALFADVELPPGMVAHDFGFVMTACLGAGADLRGKKIDAAVEAAGPDMGVWTVSVSYTGRGETLALTPAFNFGVGQVGRERLREVFPNTSQAAAVTEIYVKVSYRSDFQTLTTPWVGRIMLSEVLIY